MIYIYIYIIYIYMESWIQLDRFWNPVLPVQVSDSVLTGIGIGPLKYTGIGIGLFTGIDASLLVACCMFRCPLLAAEQIPPIQQIDQLATR